MQINQQLYFLNTKTLTIQSGLIVGSILSTSGYLMYQILMNDNSRQIVESSHCFPDKESAETHRKRVLPLIEKAETLRDDLTKEMDSLRTQIIGFPQHKELAERLTNKQTIQDNESIDVTD